MVCLLFYGYNNNNNNKRQKTHEGQRTACHVRVHLPCGFWGPNSVLQFWQQASLHAESSFGPLFLSL